MGRLPVVGPVLAASGERDDVVNYGSFIVGYRGIPVHREAAELTEPPVAYVDSVPSTRRDRHTLFEGAAAPARNPRGATRRAVGKDFAGAEPVTPRELLAALAAFALHP